MRQFLMIAAAHFLALLLPGADFLLIARTSLNAGWRVASGTCLGIALANGVFIAVAFAGLSVLRAGSAWFVAMQLAGCLYLLYLGQLFVRHAGRGAGQALYVPPGEAAGAAPAQAWVHALAMGFGSGILNPKNALFYASLAAMLPGAQASPGWRLLYGAWMFGVVLAWDVLVAALVGHPRVLQRFARLLPWLERISGLVLIAMAVAVLAMWLPRG